jgi:hypothetical protein
VRLPSPRFLIGLVLVLVVCVVTAFVLTRADTPADSTNTAEPITVSCLGGSEKSELMADPDVRRILKDTYGLTVTFNPLGSYDQVQFTTEEQLARITEFISAIEVRINEFQQRLFIGWSTSPQVRNIRSLNYGLGQRLALLVNLTIPTMKLTIAQWGLLLQANQAAQMQQAVSDGANEVLSAYASAAGKSVPQIARMIQTPTIRPETIMEVAASIEAQAKGIEDAVRFGQQARADVVTAIVVAQESMSASYQQLSRNVIDLVTRAQQPIALPAAAALPASVLEQAGMLKSGS